VPRPVKCRKVEFIPEYTYFKPTEFDKVHEEYQLKFEELEAMRLKRYIEFIPRRSSCTYAGFKTNLSKHYRPSKT
jgi:predicted DNA-binding protein (UPF0251 family)